MSWRPQPHPRPIATADELAQRLQQSIMDLNERIRDARLGGIELDLELELFIEGGMGRPLDRPLLRALMKYPGESRFQPYSFTRDREALVLEEAQAADQRVIDENSPLE